MPPPPVLSYGQTVFEEHLNSLQKRRKRFFECLCLAAHHTRITHTCTHTHTSAISATASFRRAKIRMLPHTPPERIIQEMRLYPPCCLTKRVDWTINGSMDLGKAFRETEERLSINSVVTVCDSRPGIKTAITQTCCGPKHDQSTERETPEYTRGTPSQHTNIWKQHLKPFIFQQHGVINYLHVIFLLISVQYLNFGPDMKLGYNN